MVVPFMPTAISIAPKTIRPLSDLTDHVLRSLVLCLIQDIDRVRVGVIILTVVSPVANLLELEACTSPTAQDKDLTGLVMALVAMVREVLRAVADMVTEAGGMAVAVDPLVTGRIRDIPMAVSPVVADPHMVTEIPDPLTDMVVRIMAHEGITIPGQETTTASIKSIQKAAVTGQV